MPTDPVKKQTEELAAWLKLKMEQAGFDNAAQLARDSKVSPQSLSRLLDPKPLPDTGKYHLPRRDTIKKLARPLRVTEEEALTAAGYAPQNKQVSKVSISGESSRLAVLFYRADNLFPELTAEDQAEIEALYRAADARIEQMLREKKKKKANNSQ